MNDRNWEVQIKDLMSDIKAAMSAERSDFEFGNRCPSLDALDTAASEPPLSR
jgi:hypothetical protein